MIFNAAVFVPLILQLNLNYLKGYFSTVFMQNILELENIPYDTLIENMKNIYKLYTNFLLISKNSRIKLEEDIINNLEKKNTLLNDFKNLLKNNN